MSDAKQNCYMVRTAYPADFAGIPYEVEIDQIHDWENYAEGSIRTAKASNFMGSPPNPT